MSVSCSAPQRACGNVAGISSFVRVKFSGCGVKPLVVVLMLTCRNYEMIWFSLSI